MADSIVLSHLLLPNVLRHMFGAHVAMMDPALPLSRRQHEPIAATVSALNSHTALAQRLRGEAGATAMPPES